MEGVRADGQLFSCRGIDRSPQTRKRSRAEAGVANTRETETEEGGDQQQYNNTAVSSMCYVVMSDRLTEALLALPKKHKKVVVDGEEERRGIRKPTLGARRLFNKYYSVLTPMSLW